MIIGAHSIIYSKRPEADRAFLRDALGLPHIDVGDGWLIFGLPPAEVALHPSSKNDVHEFYLMCDDIKDFVAEMKKRNAVCEPVQNQGWGLLTHVMLPGGGRLGVYEPRHARPEAIRVSKAPPTSRRLSARPRPISGSISAGASTSTSVDSSSVAPTGPSRCGPRRSSTEQHATLG